MHCIKIFLPELGGILRQPVPLEITCLIENFEIVGRGVGPKHCAWGLGGARTMGSFLFFFWLFYFLSHQQYKAHSI